MATLVTGGLRKVIADAHHAGRSRVGITKAIADYYLTKDGPGPDDLKAVVDAAEFEAHYNPRLDRDELVYQAVVKAQRDAEPSTWVLPDPEANWNAHVPFATPNFGI